MEYFKIYTSGATKNIDRSASYGWRQAAKELLESPDTPDTIYNVRIFIPEIYFSYEDVIPNINKQCYRYFLFQLERSDLILVNLDDSDKSVGTGMEVQKAIGADIPIIGFGHRHDSWYPWITESCDVIFDSLAEAVDYIKDFYLTY